jgi:hypothetical protein
MPVKPTTVLALHSIGEELTGAQMPFFPDPIYRLLISQDI